MLPLLVEALLRNASRTSSGHCSLSLAHSRLRKPREFVRHGQRARSTASGSRTVMIMLMGNVATMTFGNSWQTRVGNELRGRGVARQAGAGVRQRRGSESIPAR
jgi:hypothetical protein